MPPCCFAVLQSWKRCDKVWRSVTGRPGEATMAMPESLISGYGLIEDPVWHDQHGLFFSDVLLVVYSPFATVKLQR